MRKAKAFVRGIRNGFLILLKGDWHEFRTRLRISLGEIDLKHDPTEAITERTHYYADSGGRAFDKIMSKFSISPEDAIVDFGCGKGGILISLSKYPFSKITGVEISEDLAEIARGNIQKLRLDKIDIRCCDAADFTEMDEYTYVYFFDPFPAVVMKEVIRNIELSLDRRPRKLTVIYLNPSCHDVVASSRYLEKTGELPHFEHECFVYTNEINA